jgi:ABC-type bacteriocin/lantibiotic exporter with double-glycine peptidase domain
VPACLRTVLASFGLDVSESELRTLCDTTIFGTAALKAVDAAHALGFAGTAKHNLTLEELTAAVDAGLYPIVLVNLDPISGKEAAHAFVVVEASASGILVYDPLHGERMLPRETFRAAWALMRNVAVLVAK